VEALSHRLAISASILLPQTPTGHLLRFTTKYSKTPPSGGPFSYTDTPPHCSSPPRPQPRTPEPAQPVFKIVISSVVIPFLRFPARPSSSLAISCASWPSSPRPSPNQRPKLFSCCPSFVPFPNRVEPLSIPFTSPASILLSWRSSCPVEIIFLLPLTIFRIPWLSPQVCSPSRYNAPLVLVSVAPSSGAFSSRFARGRPPRAPGAFAFRRHCSYSPQRFCDLRLPAAYAPYPAVLAR